MTGLTVAVDLDGTCAQFQQGFAAWWKGQGYEPELPPEPDCWHYWRRLDIHDEVFAAALFAFGEAGGFGGLNICEDARVGVEALFDQGHDLIAVTSRRATREVTRSTFQWIGAFILPFRNVLIGPAAKLEAECDILLDDDPAALEQLADQGEAVGLLLDRPWNRDATGLPRVTWGEAPNVITGLAKKVEGVPASERRWELAAQVECMVD